MEIKLMKATGIVRRIDDLGRVVIPKEIRRTLRIKEGDPLEIYTDREGEVIFKKYSPMGELSEFAADYAEAINRTGGYPICITDKDSIIAVSGAPKKELYDKPISERLERVMDEKILFSIEKNPYENFYATDSGNNMRVALAAPIISEGDTIGSVVMLCGDGNTKVSEVETKLIQAAAGFLGRHMEN